MKEEELFQIITSDHKWYVGFCSKGYATQIQQRYEKGTLSQKSIDKMFDHFGYEKKQEVVWGKKAPVKQMVRKIIST